MLFCNEKMENESNIALISSEGKGLTYARLCAEAKEMEHYKTGRKLTCIICDKELETFALVFKLLYLGQPMILLSEKTADEYLKDVINRFSPDFLWKDKKLQTVKSTDDETVNEMNSDIAVLLSTSGSIGTPKFVKLSYKNLREASYMGVKNFNISRNQRGILTLPAEHIFGLNFCLYHWFAKATLVIAKYTVLDKKFAELYDLQNINNFAGIPFSYKLLKRIGFWEDEKRVEQLNCALVAGAKLDENLRKYLVSLLGERFVICYGQTETAGLVTMIRFETIENMADGIVGKPMQEVKTYLCENELVIESPTVYMGYATERAELCMGDVNLGKTYTGDIAETDEQNNIILKGRKKRFVKIMGHRYQLDDIESVLEKKLDEMCVIACTGIDDALNIYLETESIDVEVCKKIERIMLDSIDISSRMIHIHAVKQMPRSSAGKILYSKLE